MGSSTVNRSSCTGRVALAVVCVLCVVPILHAAPPVLESVQPRGIERGHEVTVTLSGKYLRPDARIITTLPGRVAAAPREANAEDLRSRLPLIVQVPADAPVGMYAIRIRTEDGLSNVVRLVVSGLPEAVEEDPNDTPAVAQVVSLPVTVNGTLGAADQDHFRFTGQAGDRVVFEVEARRLGSGVDPALRLFDERGMDLADNDDAPGLGVDARIDIVLPRTGDYVLVVHDAKFGEPSPNFYRVKMGGFPYADTLFPLGWKRGDAVNIAFVGGNLGGGDTGDSLILPPVGGWTPVGLNRAGALAAHPFHFVLSDGPEALEPPDGEVGRLVAGTVMNGRIDKPGEVDRYRMRVRPGQRLSFRIDAEALGTSQLDGLLTIYDAEGEKSLASADDGVGYDPRLNFDVPAGVDEIIVAIEDLYRRGGPAFAYRLCAQARVDDVTLRVEQPFINIARQDRAVVKVLAERRGYDGAIQLTIPRDVEGITARGGTIPAGQNEGFLILTASADAPLRAFSLPITGEFGSPAQPIRREVTSGHTRDFPGAEGVPIAVARRKPISVNLVENHLRIAQGFSATLALTAKRDDGVDGEIRVELARRRGGGRRGRRSAVRGGSGKFEEKSTKSEVRFTASATAPIGTTYSLIVATIELDGEPVSVTLPPVVIEVVPPFSLEVLTPPAAIAPGGETKLVGLVRRVAPFDEDVRIEVPDLPAGVSATAIDVAAGQFVFEMPLKTTSVAQPGNVKVVLKGSTEESRRRVREFQATSRTKDPRVSVTTRLEITALPSETAQAEGE